MPRRTRVPQTLPRFRPGATRRDQRVEFELTVHVAVDQRGNVDGRPHRAVVRAENPLVGLGQDQRFEGCPGAGGRQADDHRGPAEAQHPDGLFGGGGPSDRVEGVVHAVGDQFEQLVHDVALGGVDAVGRTELDGQLGFAGQDVDGDDAFGAGESCALDDVESHTAATDHGDRRAGDHGGGVGHRAHSGGHRAAHHGHHVQGASSRTFTAPDAGTTTSSAKEDTPR